MGVVQGTQGLLHTQENEGRCPCPRLRLRMGLVYGAPEEQWLCAHGSRTGVQA